MPDPTRRLWQIPTFLLGAAVFLGTYQGWLPLGARDPGSSFRVDLGALQSLAAMPNPDPIQLRNQLQRVAAASDAFPESGPFAHFILGTGYVRLAELTADLADAQTSWTLAKQHFEAVQSGQLPDPADGPRLAYRFAKARAAIPNPSLTQAELELARRLLLSVPIGETTGEGNRLAAEISLRMTPPDLGHARLALSAYIGGTGLATPPASIARAKLKLSEVHRQQGDVDGAKKWLSQIGTDAPPDVLPVAKAQLARIRMDEGDYIAARRDWEILLVQPSLPAGLKPLATYQLGMCFLNGKPVDYASAARRFEEATKIGGVEGAAAAVRLAEIWLKSDDPAHRKDSASLLAFAMKGVANPEEYPKAALVPIQDVQAAFESTIQSLMADGSFDVAVSTAEAYKAVAATGRDREQRADVLASWGASLQKSGADATAKFTQAADDYAALAQLRTADTDKADLFRRAAGFYKQAGNANAAIDIYEQTAKLSNLPDEVHGPILLEFADTLVSLNKPDAALKALQGVMLKEGPAATTARYRLARTLIESRVTPKVDLGVDLMDQIAKAEKVTSAEEEMHERALVDVAHAYIQRGDFAEAEARLQKQVKLYPTGGESGLGKLLLGVCLIQRADARAKPPAANPAKNREEALKLFKLVASEVEARAKDNKATERDPWLRAQASLRVLQTYQQMARPYDVLKDGDALRRQFAGTADELIVLSLMYHAYKQLDKPEGSFSIHGQMRETFDRIKDKPDVFWAKNGEYSREYWEKVWFQTETPKTP
jgi:tetratricopeptide (TPR) repeat protein